MHLGLNAAAEMFSSSACIEIAGDPFVVDQLKTHFQRLRPSDILNTYAFPSGHTTAAVFIMGKNLHLASWSSTRPKNSYTLSVSHRR